MALIDNVPEFAAHLASMPGAENLSQSAHNLAAVISEHFAFATLDGVDIAAGSNVAPAPVLAFTLKLIEAFSVKDDPEASSLLMEQAFLDYLNNGPISDMWAAAVSATKDGPDLHEVMLAATEGFEESLVLSKLATARGLTQWINESVKVELDETPARYEWVV